MEKRHVLIGGAILALAGGVSFCGFEDDTETPVGDLETKTSDDSKPTTTVKSALVDHPPVVPAVGYRVETPDGIVAVSGDTRVCPGLEALCEDADIAVCEVIRLEGEGALAQGLDLIACDGGSMDPGPYYLGEGTPCVSRHRCL